MNGAPRLERAIGRVLHAGVTASSACLAAGLGLSLFPTNAAAATAAHSLLTAGVVILMATPVGRVLISVGEYVLARDWWFVLLTTTVLLELLASVVAAFR